MKTLACNSYISKISTSADGGYSVTLAISETDMPLIQELIKMKSKNSVVVCAFQEISGEVNEHQE